MDNTNTCTNERQHIDMECCLVVEIYCHVGPTQKYRITVRLVALSPSPDTFTYTVPWLSARIPDDADRPIDYSTVLDLEKAKTKLDALKSGAHPLLRLPGVAVRSQFQSPKSQTPWLLLHNSQPSADPHRADPHCRSFNFTHKRLTASNAMCFKA